jgi:hypothetical protein
MGMVAGSRHPVQHLCEQTGRRRWSLVSRPRRTKVLLAACKKKVGFIFLNREKTGNLLIYIIFTNLNYFLAFLFRFYKN